MTDKIIYTKKIGQWLSFAAKPHIIRINDHQYNYSDILDYKCIEETAPIEVYDYLKIYAAKEADKYIKQASKEALTKVVDGLKRLQIIFELNDGHKEVVDFIGHLQEPIVVGSHQYYFYHDAYLDAQKALTIMKRGMANGK